MKKIDMRMAHRRVHYDVPVGRQVGDLAWNDATDSATQGKDLAAVARTLTAQQLRFWMRRLAPACPHEYEILRAELERREGLDAELGPLFGRNTTP